MVQPIFASDNRLFMQLKGLDNRGGYKRWTFSETMDFLGFDGLSPSVSPLCVSRRIDTWQIFYLSYCLRKPVLKYSLIKVRLRTKVPLGPFKCYVTQMGVGGVLHFPEKSVTKTCVRSNVISVTRGWVGVTFP